MVRVVIDGELGGYDVARDRAGDYAADRLVKAGLDRRAEITRPVEAGRRRPQDDRAARHVAPEQQALGTTQHLDALEIEIVEHDARRNAHVDAVDEQADRRIDRGDRSEEHTSELQSLMRISYAVFCLKKKQ